MIPAGGFRKALRGRNTIINQKGKAMKKIKKILALVLALTMCMGMASTVAFAAEDTDKMTETVSVSGLEDGDSVKFIKVIQWDDENGWTYVTGLTPAQGETLPDIKTITGNLDTTTDPATFTAGSISAEHAAILAKAAASLDGTTVDAVSGTATYENAPVGLYYAQVIPGTSDYLYNTIFVGADFKSNGTNTIAAASAKLNPTTEGKEAIAKKEQVTLTKDANGNTDNIKYDHAVGDVIPFTITSQVPAYGAGYVNPSYVITDTMDENLVLSKADGTDGTKDDITVEIADVDLAADDYTVAVNGQTFTVTLNKSGLDKVAALGAAKQITVTYNARITSIANATVNQKKNKATVQFSNKPTDSTSVSRIEDKTRHYTFSIDANLFGNDEWETSELVKIGIDENGNEITKVTGYDNGSSHGALGGAIFGLYKTKAAAEAGKATDTPETNPDMVAVQTSDAADGKLCFEGLDATKYYLVELKAPDGWIKDPAVKEVEITATYEEIQGGTYEDTDGVIVKYDAYKVLKEYSIAIEGGATSTYTITNNKAEDADDAAATGATVGTTGDKTTKLNNTKGTELPSTGGIGTTIFYVFGTILVIFAGVVLVTRRRMNA